MRPNELCSLTVGDLLTDYTHTVAVQAVLELGPDDCLVLATVAPQEIDYVVDDEPVPAGRKLLREYVSSVRIKYHVAEINTQYAWRDCEFITAVNAADWVKM